MAPAEVAEVSVVVAWSSAPRQVQTLTLTLPCGATVADAVRAALRALPDAASHSAVGVWGRAVSMDRMLHDGDRIEIYRPLRADPKQSRRLRYQAHVERWGKYRTSKVSGSR